MDSLKQQVLTAGLFGRTTLQNHPELVQIWTERMQQISSTSIKYAVEAVLNANSILDQLLSIHVPTIVAGGGEDTSLSMPASQAIHQRIKDSALVEIEACGHSSSVEQPKRVNQLLEQLLMKTNCG